MILTLLSGVVNIKIYDLSIFVKNKKYLCVSIAYHLFCGKISKIENSRVVAFAA